MADSESKALIPHGSMARRNKLIQILRGGPEHSEWPRDKYGRPVPFDYDDEKLCVQGFMQHIGWGDRNPFAMGRLLGLSAAQSEILFYRLGEHYNLLTISIRPLHVAGYLIACDSVVSPALAKLNNPSDLDAAAGGAEANAQLETEAKTIKTAEAKEDAFADMEDRIVQQCTQLAENTERLQTRMVEIVNLLARFGERMDTLEAAMAQTRRQMGFDQFPKDHRLHPLPIPLGGQNNGPPNPPGAEAS